MGPRTHVVILNWNGRRYVRDCLDSVFAQTHEEAKILVVDNGSTDGSAEFIRDAFPEAVLIALPENLHFARGTNAGVEVALRDPACEFVVTLNNDTRSDPEFLAGLVKWPRKDGLGWSPRNSCSWTDRRSSTRQGSARRGMGAGWTAVGTSGTKDNSTARRMCSHRRPVRPSIAEVSSTAWACSMQTSSRTTRTWTSPGELASRVGKRSSRLARSCTTSTRVPRATNPLGRPIRESETGSGTWSRTIPFSISRRESPGTDCGCSRLYAGGSSLFGTPLLPGPPQDKVQPLPSSRRPRSARASTHMPVSEERSRNDGCGMRTGEWTTRRSVGGSATTASRSKRCL